MKTSKLSGAALDWAVAQCKGFPVRNGFDDNCPEYSTKWSEGGPIIEEEGISINSHLDGYEWFARDYWGLNEHAAETPLVAAMRCYVAGNLGEDVNVPEELGG